MANEPDVCEECQSVRPATPPSDSCCGSGCAVCVYDIHDQEIDLWKKTCKRKHGADKSQLESSETVMDLMDYKYYTLQSIVAVCTNTAVYRFALPPGKKLDLSIAKHIILRGKHDGKMITRQYTPISQPHDTGFFDVLIKLYVDGDMSQYIKEWKIGDNIEWRGPFGSFTYQPNKGHYILAIAAGTGITPIIQVMRHLVENEEDETVFRLLYTCRSYDEILLRETLNELALYWNITIIFNLTQSSPGSHPIGYGETIQYGRFTRERLSKEVAASMGRHVRALICGTRSFENDMSTFLKESGVPGDSIEKF
ncbi:NADH-cytochrome b5 reductase-like [Lytechinus variegatus]|uniref:NADH-cytochrome b5 reductase-like n=1 Tax=Lytechinus variegatus TaxID=7654 RepID=UPI001BB137EA|nr:NADH-cytochrome b5 reductase-like [Lytechinus variegatus]XP_041476199.1 NADH-cytochrome b5 reductase-like [Lytechinus variegatus]